MIIAIVGRDMVECVDWTTALQLVGYNGAVVLYDYYHRRWMYEIYTRKSVVV